MYTSRFSSQKSRNYDSVRNMPHDSNRKMLDETFYKAMNKLENPRSSNFRVKDTPSMLPYSGMKPRQTSGTRETERTRSPKFSLKISSNVSHFNASKNTDFTSTISKEIRTSKFPISTTSYLSSNISSGFSRRTNDNNYNSSSQHLNFEDDDKNDYISKQPFKFESPPKKQRAESFSYKRQNTATNTTMNTHNYNSRAGDPGTLRFNAKSPEKTEIRYSKNPESPLKSPRNEDLSPRRFGPTTSGHVSPEREKFSSPRYSPGRRSSFNEASPMKSQSPSVSKHSPERRYTFSGKNSPTLSSNSFANRSPSKSPSFRSPVKSTSKSPQNSPPNLFGEFDEKTEHDKFLERVKRRMQKKKEEEKANKLKQQQQKQQEEEQQQIQQKEEEQQIQQKEKQQQIQQKEEQQMQQEKVQKVDNNEMKKPIVKHEKIKQKTEKVKKHEPIKDDKNSSPKTSNRFGRTDANTLRQQSDDLIKNDKKFLEEISNLYQNENDELIEHENEDDIDNKKITNNNNNSNNSKVTKKDPFQDQLAAFKARLMQNTNQISRSSATQEPKSNETKARNDYGISENLENELKENENLSSDPLLSSHSSDEEDIKPLINKFENDQQPQIIEKHEDDYYSSSSFEKADAKNKFNQQIDSQIVDHKKEDTKGNEDIFEEANTDAKDEIINIVEEEENPEVSLENIHEEESFEVKVQEDNIQDEIIETKEVVKPKEIVEAKEKSSDRQKSKVSKQDEFEFRFKDSDSKHHSDPIMFQKEDAEFDMDKLYQKHEKTSSPNKDEAMVRKDDKKSPPRKPPSVYEEDTDKLTTPQLLYEVLNDDFFIQPIIEYQIETSIKLADSFLSNVLKSILYSE